MNQHAALATALKRSPDTTGEKPPASDTASQIKDALLTAKNLAVFLDASEAIDRLRALRAQRSPVRQANMQADMLLASVLEKSHFDAEKLKAIQADSHAELRRIVQAQQAEAVKNSAQAKATFRAAIESRRKVMERVLGSFVEGVSPVFQQVVLDAPFLIWPSVQTSELFFDNSQIHPWNSWAKFKVDSTSEVGLTGIEFYFFWENQSRQAVSINVNSWLMLSGYGRTDIPQHWNDEFSLIEIQARLSLLEWWNQPPTSPVLQSAQKQQVLDLSVEFSGGPLFTFMTHPEGATWWGHGWGEGVSQGCDLHYNQELVPPGGGVVIKVSTDVSWINHGGAGIEADFDSGDFEVMCPFVQIQIINPSRLTIKAR